LKALILHYGVGNVFSVTNTFKKLGFEVKLSSKPVQGFDCVILPGVGSFTAASETIAAFRQELVDLVTSGIPTLGICLGMQLLFESSEEGPGTGLGILRGKVISLPPDVKKPHMGWNRLYKVREHTLLEGLDNEWVYFNHTYHPEPENREVVLTWTRYGSVFPSTIGWRNVLGTQFHPEKSSKAGMRLLQNFKEIVRR